jgi:hypothetical protein
MHADLFKSSRGSGPPLRIGLLLDRSTVARCFAEVVDHISQSDFAEIVLLIFNSEEQQVAAPQPMLPLPWSVVRVLTDSGSRSKLLFSVYQKMDSRRVSAADDPLAPVDLSERLRGIESLSVTPAKKRFVHRFPPNAVEEIRRQKIDVLLRFGFNILRGDILTAAKYGVWSYHHGDNDDYRGGPAHFWEIYEGNPMSGVILQVLTEQLDAGKVLYKGLFSTRPGISTALNRVQPYWGASTFVIQKLRELHEHGWEHVEGKVLAPVPYRGKKTIYTKPSNLEMVRWLARLVVSKSVRSLFRLNNIKHWRLAIRGGSKAIPDATNNPDLGGFRWIESPRGHFYADPFLTEVDGKTWLFFEDFDYRTQRGRISCGEIRDGSLADVRPVLERDYHLSYPCVFRDGDAMYMIPESASSGSVELYRCICFPDEWRLEKELFRGQAVDTTVCVHNGLCWFFVTMLEPHGRATQLWLFYAESLTGEWIRHPANPISTDVRNSRGAGAIFIHHGRLYRPSQDCGRHYGYSFTFNEILAIDKQQYRESPAVTVLPGWSKGLVATHSYSRVGNIEVIDGCSVMPAARVLAADK